ncbi:YciI family protein [Herbidospora cretacea]|uniref:YciI family protein n=1 Tax=Herbidospora cretacea TaxID=28444 RepID=UPI0004C3FD70|nr:YciI family protein [Herbidospora cretacea]
MKYMIMLYGSQRDFDAMATGGPEVAEMHAFMEKWNNDLVESGEFVDAKGLSAPVHTRRVSMKGGVPVVTEGPYPETQEVLVGYTIVECAGFDRATEIAARLAHTPGRQAEGQYVDVRPIMEHLDDMFE